MFVEKSWVDMSLIHILISVSVRAVQLNCVLDQSHSSVSSSLIRLQRNSFSSRAHKGALVLSHSVDPKRSPGTRIPPRPRCSALKWMLLKRRAFMSDPERSEVTVCVCVCATRGHSSCLAPTDRSGIKEQFHKCSETSVRVDRSTDRKNEEVRF